MVTVRTQQGVGSGVVFKPDVLITNAHVVQGAKQVRIAYADGWSASRKTGPPTLRACGRAM